MTTTNNEPHHGDMLRSRMKRSLSSSLSTSELDKYDGESYEQFNKNVNYNTLLW